MRDVAHGGTVARAVAVASEPSMNPSEDAILPPQQIEDIDD